MAFICKSKEGFFKEIFFLSKVFIANIFGLFCPFYMPENNLKMACVSFRMITSEIPTHHLY